MLYYYPNEATFVRKDLAIFGLEYRIKTRLFPHAKKNLLPLLWLKQFLDLLWNVWRADIVVVQFGGHHSLLPALMGRLSGTPCLIITGGTDCFAIPQIGYGNFNKPFLAWVTKWTYKLASALSPVHESLSWSEYTYLDPPSRQGVYHFVPGLKTPSATIYNGYDPNLFNILPEIERPEATFLTVADTLGSRVKFMRKGTDLVLEMARRFPKAQFTIVGLTELEGKPDNVQLQAFMPSHELPRLYNRHRYYFQLSVAEGFPNALSEAMLCGCVPIVSAVAAMPYMVEGAGYILPKKSEDGLEAVVNQALSEYHSYSAQHARAQVVERFHIDIRKEKLLALCRALRVKGNYPFDAPVL